MNSSPFLSFLPPYPSSPPPSLPPVPPPLSSTFPTEGRPYCDGRTCKGATLLLSPPLLPGLNIFGDRDWLMLVIDNILSFLIHVHQCISSLRWKGKLLLPFLQGQPLKASGEKLWKSRQWTLMLCLRLHCRVSLTWKQANKRVMKWKNKRRVSAIVFRPFYVRCFCFTVVGQNVLNLRLSSLLVHFHFLPVYCAMKTVVCF